MGRAEPVPVKGNPRVQTPKMGANTPQQMSDRQQFSAKTPIRGNLGKDRTLHNITQPISTRDTAPQYQSSRNADQHGGKPRAPTGTRWVGQQARHGCRRESELRQLTQGYGTPTAQGMVHPSLSHSKSGPGVFPAATTAISKWHWGQCFCAGSACSSRDMLSPPKPDMPCGATL